MGSGGKVEYRKLEAFQKKLQKNLTGTEMNSFIESCAKELAARLLAKVIKRTPVGQYPTSSGKKGGTLRRGWTGGKSGGSAYAQSLKVNHYGDVYVIEIVNPVEYASYVEYGHRTRNHEGWVEGKFMMTISEGEVRRNAPKILENKLKRKLGECFKL
jgi:hypothetical protein